jgi:hypothetical protein
MKICNRRTGARLSPGSRGGWSPLALAALATLEDTFKLVRIYPRACCRRRRLDHSITLLGSDRNRPAAVKLGAHSRSGLERSADKKLFHSDRPDSTTDPEIEVDALAVRIELKDSDEVLIRDRIEPCRQCSPKHQSRHEEYSESHALGIRLGFQPIVIG